MYADDELNSYSVSDEILQHAKMHDKTENYWYISYRPYRSAQAKTTFEILRIHCNNLFMKLKSTVVVMRIVDLQVLDPFSKEVLTCALLKFTTLCTIMSIYTHTKKKKWYEIVT